MATHSSILPGEFHGLYSPWGHKESDTTKQLNNITNIYKPLHLWEFVVAVLENKYALFASEHLTG